MESLTRMVPPPFSSFLHNFRFIVSADNVDLLVLGGGPAGSAAAIMAARAGLRVVVFERSIFPRHRPGETLHPGVAPLLERIGALHSILSANYVRHPGTWVKW